MKKRFYIFALLTAISLNHAYARESIKKDRDPSNWDSVPLTDTNDFDVWCQYRFFTSTKFFYITTLTPSEIYVSLPDSQGGGYSIKSTDKSDADPINPEWRGFGIDQLQKRCD